MDLGNFSIPVRGYFLRRDGRLNSCANSILLLHTRVFRSGSRGIQKKVQAQPLIDSWDGGRLFRDTHAYVGLISVGRGRDLPCSLKDDSVYPLADERVSHI